MGWSLGEPAGRSVSQTVGRSLYAPCIYRFFCGRCDQPYSLDSSAPSFRTTPPIQSTPRPLTPTRSFSPFISIYLCLSLSPSLPPPLSFGRCEKEYAELDEEEDEDEEIQAKVAESRQAGRISQGLAALRPSPTTIANPTNSSTTTVESSSMVVAAAAVAAERKASREKIPPAGKVSWWWEAGEGCYLCCVRKVIVGEGHDVVLFLFLFLFVLLLLLS